MRSLIAALRTLVLPWGATSGPRIVLDGVNGRIEIYGNTGALLMTLDDDGLIVYDTDGDIRQQLGQITDFSSITFRDSNGDNPAILTYQSIPGDDSYRAMSWQAPGTSLDFPRLINLTPNNLVKNPLLQWDTGLLDPTVAQPIVDFTGFGPTSDPRKAMVVASEYRTGDSQGGGNAPNVGDSLIRADAVTPKIQFGTVTVPVVNGITNAFTTVNFPDTFTNIPVVCLTPSSSGARPIIVEARNRAVGSFDAFLRTADGVAFGGAANFVLNYIAIEEAPIP